MQIFKKIVLGLIGGLLVGCASPQTCRLALEQAEQANQRIDQIVEQMHSKST